MAAAALPLLTSAGAGATATAISGSSLFAALPSIGSVLSFGSAIGSIVGGNQEAAVYKAQAKQSEFAARTEELKGRDQANKIRDSLRATLASQNAAFAARGISLNSGSPMNLANQSKTQASQDIQYAQFGSDMAAAAERGTAQQQRMSAGAAKTKGYVSAASSLYKGGSLL